MESAKQSNFITGLGWENRTLLYLAIFIVPYFAATTVFQLLWDFEINTEGSPFDRMNGGLLWLAASMALMNAVLRSDDLRRTALWLLGCAAIGVVALDELFALHEHSEGLTGDDDHPKILLFLCAVAGVFILNALENLNRKSFWLIVAGLSAHFIYLLVDMGDGDYFSLPLAKPTLHWIEEYLELTASASYFSALFLQAVMTFKTSKTNE